LVAKHARPDRRTAIEHVLLTKADRPDVPSASSQGTVLSLTVQGTKRLATGSEVHECEAGQFALVSAIGPVAGHYVGVTSERPGLGIGLIMSPIIVAETLVQLPFGHRPVRDDAGGPVLVCDASPDLLDAVARLVRLLERPRDIGALAPLIKREILWRLITDHRGISTSHLGHGDGRLALVYGAVRSIQDNYAESFRVADLARLSGMSVSSFHRNFHAVMEMSPIQYQKQIRLQQARLLITSRRGDIASVSRHVGYDSPSQFSREYRRRFGVSPRDDAAPSQ
jgi:AraC-like DNA-binding protein